MNDSGLNIPLESILYDYHEEPKIGDSSDLIGYKLQGEYKCPYCGQVLPIGRGYIIKKRGQLLSQNRRLTQRGKNTYITTERTYEQFYVRMCESCHQKRRRQKYRLIQLSFLTFVIHLTILIIQEIIRIPNLFGLWELAKSICNHIRNMFPDCLGWPIATSIITYLFGLYILRKIQRKTFSKKEAYQLNAIATKEEIYKKYQGDEDNL